MSLFKFKTEEAEKEAYRNGMMLFVGLTTIFSFFTMLATSYVAYILFRLVEGLRQISDELGKFGN